MKKLQDDFTTPEQSERLLWLGVPADSANLYYFDVGSGFVNAPDLREYKENWSDCRYLPCWSAGRLMEILAICCENPMFFTARTIVLESGMIDYCVRTFANSVKLKIIDFSRLEE